MPNADTLYTTAEAADYLRMSKAMVLRLINTGKLKASRFSRRNIVVSGANLEAYVNGHETVDVELEEALAEGSSLPVDGEAV